MRHTKAELIQSFNHLGQCIGHDKVRRYHTDMATLTAEKNSNDVPIPSHFDTETFTTAFLIMKKQPYQELVAAKTQCRVLFEDKPAYPSCKHNVSESSVIHGSKILNSGLHCKAIFQVSKETGCTIFL